MLLICRFLLPILRTLLTGNDPVFLFVGACFNHHHHPILAEDLGFFFQFFNLIKKNTNFVTEHELQSSIAQLSQISIF
jgi:hypothetical protein